MSPVSQNPEPAPTSSDATHVDRLFEVLAESGMSEDEAGLFVAALAHEVLIENTLRPNRGAPERYEITWRTGHVETVWAHQVSYPNAMSDRPRRVDFHGETPGGRWTLRLSVLEADVQTIRNITDGEQIGSES